MIISQIIKEKQKNILNLKKTTTTERLKERCQLAMQNRRNFKNAISASQNINLIAELKKASPSRGVIRQDFNPQELAKIYQLNGASAISVITEEVFFKGSVDYLTEVKKVCSLPLLRKDFIVDEYQIYESCAYGADAVLLIADILSEEQLGQFRKTAHSLKMHVLAEAHSEEDLKKILKSKTDIIGINNRDLHTFKVNIKTAENIIKHIPDSKIKVIESGIKSNSDILFYKSLGANAVLVGEAFMAAEDIGGKVREFLGK